MSGAWAWYGLTAFEHALSSLVDKIDKETFAATTELASILEREAKSNFEGSHRKGQPHQGGSRPNVVTGHLRRSIQRESVQRLGAGYYMTRVYPTAIYGRAIELGRAGHNSAYPYFGPALKTTRERAHAVLIKHWGGAL